MLMNFRPIILAVALFLLQRNAFAGDSEYKRDVSEIEGLDTKQLILKAHLENRTKEAWYYQQDNWQLEHLEGDVWRRIDWIGITRDIPQPVRRVEPGEKAQATYKFSILAPLLKTGSYRVVDLYFLRDPEGTHGDDLVKAARSMVTPTFTITR